MAYVVNVNDPSTPTNSQGAKQGAEELRAIKLKLQAIVAGAVITTAAGANTADVQTFIQPSVEDRPAISAGGWLPWNLNQQWGGAPMPFHMVDAATGTEYKFDAFDQNIEQNTLLGWAVGDAAGDFYQYQVLTSPKAVGLQAVWVKVFKSGAGGNPTDNLVLKLWSVAAGTPNVLVATANVINGKQITSEQAPGQWYRFLFAAVQNLVVNTQYMLTLEKSGGVDANNYYVWTGTVVGTRATRYPNNLAGTGTAAPVWTPANTNSKNFICEAQASDQVVQSGGQFTGKIVGSEGNPINRSVAFNKPLKDFFPLFHPNGWSILIRGKTWTKDRTIFDAMYGLHHDRINIRSATGTGFTTVTVYESDNTVTTVTGNTDISAATYKDILIVGRSLNDAGDYIKVYTGINNVWTKEAESTGLSLIFDPLMLKQGTAWIMGGFQLFKNTDYTKLSDMTILPSADGWTYTTSTATVEGSVFTVSGGKLSQIKSGMAAGGDGWYKKTATAFVNANGWMMNTKLRVAFSFNTKSTRDNAFALDDGTKQYISNQKEYYTEDHTSARAYTQIDLKSAESTILLTGKGSDALKFINGRLVDDATSFLTVASASNGMTANSVEFGDISAAANENADILWDYVGYYNTSNMYPQFTSGELHEFAVFAGDKNLLGQALYNLGVPLSTKQYCGVQKNYSGEVIPQKFTQVGITGTPTTASTTPILSPEMEVFALGSEVSILHNNANFNSGANTDVVLFGIDGNFYPEQSIPASRSRYGSAQGGGTLGITNVAVGSLRLNFGLHKINGLVSTSGGTLSGWGQMRQLTVEMRP